MSNPSKNELQIGIFNALNGFAPLTALAPVFDFVDENQNYPYVEIGDNTSTDFDTATSRGFDSTIVIHTWAVQNGRKASWQIMDQIYAALHEVEFPMSGQVVIVCREEFSNLALDPDGATYHGVQRFRALIQGV